MEQVWALEQMFKYSLQVDFSRRTIDCRGYTCGWGWNFADNSDFYEALNLAIKDITK